MLRGFILCIVFLIALGIAGGCVVCQHMEISALGHPSRIETYLATGAKHSMVARAAQQPLPTETPNTADNIEDGHTNFGSACAGCHGYDGGPPHKMGNSFYSEAPPLALAAV